MQEALPKMGLIGVDIGEKQKKSVFMIQAIWTLDSNQITNRLIISWCLTLMGVVSTICL
jgi:hypothetical protein